MAPASAPTPPLRPSLVPVGRCFGEGEASTPPKSGTPILRMSTVHACSEVCLRSERVTRIRAERAGAE
eukprot:11178989-Alexandrium_andersonii.AAC.1